ncbi:hydroxyacylglutathione hydrolase [Aeromonas veronii]
MFYVDKILSLDDNIIWVLHYDNKAIVVDPGDGASVIEYLAINNLKLIAVFVTHNHMDHIAGIPTLLACYPTLRIYSPLNLFEGRTHNLNIVIEGDEIYELNCSFRVISLPGHTVEHIGFISDKHFFCGDVLFSAGCGRVANKMFYEMYLSLDKIKLLPSDTYIYCAHDYIKQNLNFAHIVEPQNNMVIKCINLLNENLFLIPTTLDLELQINPFLRCSNESIINAVKNKAVSDRPEDVFEALRKWRNNFQG